jgi:DNA-directed RNA polymerase sigma subunit (sigma70/sigma32)
MSDEGKRKYKQDYDIELAVLYYLQKGEEHDFSEIAEFCGVSKERIKQIHNTAIRKLRPKIKKILEDNKK